MVGTLDATGPLRTGGTQPFVSDADDTGGMNRSAEPFGQALAAAQRGEDWAVAVSWRDLNPRLLRYLRVRHDHSYEDVASETWMKVAAGLPRFTGGEEAFRAWFFTVAHSVSVDSTSR